MHYVLASFTIFEFSVGFAYMRNMQIQPTDVVIHCESMYSTEFGEANPFLMFMSIINL